MRDSILDRVDLSGAVMKLEDREIRRRSRRTPESERF